MDAPAIDTEVYMQRHFPQFRRCPDCNGKKISESPPPQKHGSYSVTVEWCERCGGQGVIQIDEGGENPYMPASHE